MTTTFMAGDDALHVRSSTAALDEALREIFADHQPSPSSPDARPDVSFWVPDGGEPHRRLPTLFAGCTAVLRTKSVERLIHGMHGQLEDPVRRRRGDVVALEALAAVDVARRTAALLPRSVRYLQPAVPQLFERYGLRVLDGFVVTLDPDTGALVVPPGFVIDRDQARRIGALSPSPGVIDAVPAGRYEVVHWYRNMRSPSKSSLLVQVVRTALCNGEAVGISAAMNGIARALRGARVVSLHDIEPGAAHLARAVARQIATSPE